MPSNKTFEHASCPFCALVCDDLKITSSGKRLAIPEGFPKFCRSSYEKASQITVTAPRYKGKEITTADAVEKASAMLKKAKHPLFGGLITDIQGMRALLPLARKCNAALDHIDSNKTLRNLKVFHSYGIVGATLSEIRRRADLMIFIGEHLFDDYPRLLERIYQPKLKKPKPKPKAVLIGPWQDKEIPEILKADLEIVDIAMSKLPASIQKLSVQIHRRFNHQYAAAATADDTADAPYAMLAEAIARAEYPAFIWSAKDMNYPHADIGILTLSQLIKKINLKKRCVGLILSGNRGAGNVQSVCLWQSGYPGYLSFDAGETHYNPLHNRTAELLDRGQCDLLVWIASIHPEPPPKSDLPTIAFVHPMIAEQTTSDLVVPIGIPGIDHGGYSYRTDGVVILPLPKLRDSKLPALHDLLHEIYASL